MSSGFQVFEVDLVASATNVISEPFAWLVSNGLRKTCAALQCIRMVVCGTAFFIKVPLFAKTVIEIPQKNAFLGNF